LLEFELVLHAQNWHEDRVWFHDANGRLRALPASWTSVVGEDPSHTTWNGTVTLLMVERVKTLNISIPDLCGKAIQL
jgi:hypothetical protein